MVRGDTPTQTQAARTLLIVDDEKSLRFSIGEWARDAGFRPVEAASGREALERMAEHDVDAVVLDLKLGDEDGLQLLARLREADPSLPVIMLTGHGTVEHAVKATRLGAYDFMLKPPDLEHLQIVLTRALEHARLRREVDHLRGGAGAMSMLGESAGFRRAIQQLDKVAKSGAATVLIQGETGSGKELMARYLHARSPRAAAAFVDLNCSAIPEQLLESQLFGHEKGAFTDAKHFRKGLFDLADQGTLFLDEIGEMAPQLQSKLLRVLETRSFRRVGGHADVSVDVRIVAATHRDLKQQVADGRFREDLYFRLNVVPIAMPPLRERREDIALLAGHFIARFAAEMGRTPARLDPVALRAMNEYPWPGNVRELKNVIERVLLLEAEDEIRAEHLPAELTGLTPAAGAARGAAPSGAAPFPPGVVRPLVEIEQMAITHALEVCSGNKTRAAQMLGISRQTLRTKLKELRMDDGADADEAGPA
ncbi:MAG: sigma-54-dependent Fis family transcriptional regulator [Candidatus Eisenbacteria bacterium]|uniref:Sigma-54-dependent Fis family transcriptional regulator n=1 Tax=Eiseniibacteriota bacterium TaxID=2212470 RepID=A0A9D6L6W7_UNCEI|nr:sigma-54-dependent Fis family transcriptional regulator [Candidatus Eisenbacteria bacterium]MBI3539731.1 sigma-54-dependent Fis family transcriptional regulator [Candidatus Eisenbacteria bacterium]